MFESSVTAVNKARHGNDELSHAYFVPETNEIDTDLYEVSSKGEAL